MLFWRSTAPSATHRPRFMTKSPLWSRIVHCSPCGQWCAAAPELAGELDAAAVVPGHVGQVVGELVPGVQMHPLAGLDLAKLVVPLVQMPLELSLCTGIAPLPVPPLTHIGRGIREIENPRGASTSVHCSDAAGSTHTGKGLASSPNSRSAG